MLADNPAARRGCLLLASTLGKRIEHCILSNLQLNLYNDYRIITNNGEPNGKEDGTLSGIRGYLGGLCAWIGW